MIQVALVDDHTIVTEALTQSLSTSGLVEVLFTCRTIADSRKALLYRQPEVLLLDISLPDGDGTVYCKEVLKTYSRLKVIALSTHEEYSYVRRMMDAGASGYIMKSAGSKELIEGILEVVDGRQYWSTGVERVIRHHKPTDIILTSREREVLKLIVEGANNPQIAERLFLSPETVKGYRKNLLMKFNVHNTASLVRTVLSEGIE